MSEIAKFFPVSEEEKENILQEVGKSRKDIEEDINIIREWLKKQPHIPEITDDSFIQKVLLRNKCRVEKAKVKIDSYFTSKIVYADIYDSIDPGTKEMIAATKLVCNTILPKLTPNNTRVHYFTSRLTKDDNYDSKSIIRYSALLSETQFLYDDCPKLLTIFDAKGFLMKHAIQMDMAIQSKMYKLLYEAFSGRIEAMHTVNISPAAEMVMNLMKPLFPVKLRNRMFFHSTFESLHKIIPKDCLPIEVGGTGPSAIEISKHMAETFVRDREHILKRNKIGTNEKLRIGEPPINNGDMFGVDGTFKLITLD